MNNLVKSELFKLGKDRSFRTLTFMLIAVAALYPLLVVMDNPVDLVKMEEFYLYDVLGGNSYIMRLVPCILAGFFISSEYSIGTMKSIGASGNNRLRIYFAKLMAFSVGSIIISLILPIVMTGAGAVYFSFHEMPDFGLFMRTIGLTVLYATSFASIMALFAFIFTDGGKTIGFLLILFLMFDSVLFLLSEKVPIFEPIFNYSVFKLATEISLLDLGNDELIKLIVVPIITFIIIGFIGSLLYQKKEIK